MRSTITITTPCTIAHWQAAPTTPASQHPAKARGNGPRPGPGAGCTHGQPGVEVVQLCPEVSMVQGHYQGQAQGCADGPDDDEDESGNGLGLRLYNQVVVDAAGGAVQDASTSAGEANSITAT